MKSIGWIRLFAGLLAGSFLWSCGSSSNGSSSPTTGAGSTFAITGCSLGCASGLGGQQISCGTLNIFVNQEIAIEFSQNVSLASVNKNTFQIVEVQSGKTPLGSFLLDPANPKRLIFRPQLTFDSSGNPVFGLNQGQSYTIRIPGTNQDPGPYIRSVDGKNNLARMLCTVAATQGINDPIPGAPSVVATVTRVTATDPNGNPTAFETAELTDTSQGTVTDVFRDTQIRFVFNDIMNPATLVDPVSGQSNTIHILVDPDGNISDNSDQIELFGSFVIDIDEDDLLTTVVFTPSSGLPSAGSGTFPRRIVVQLPATILDLGGNSLSNGGTYSFVPEKLAFNPVVLPEPAGESFLTLANRDARRSGAIWGDDPALPGVLLPGTGGGSGRLGDLLIEAGEVMVLCTEADCSSIDLTEELGAGTVTVNSFTGRNLLGEGPGPFDPDTGPTIDVMDGIFEFSTVTVQSGGILVFAGANPARLYGRGDVVVQGEIDAGGKTPPSDFNVPLGHNGTTIPGGLGGRPGPNAGRGGDGGDRWNTTAPTLLAVGGIPNPTAVRNGNGGWGVGGTPPPVPNPLPADEAQAVLPGPAGGPGGIFWPAMGPSSTTILNDMKFNALCASDMVASPGGGGAYATNGTASDPKFPNPFLNVDTVGLAAPPTPGGQSSDIVIDANVMKLDPEAGDLRGGSGGGGAGSHLVQTNLIPGPFGQCSMPLTIQLFKSNSGAGGGGGGGALQVQAGRLARVDGTLDLAGGRGGRNFAAGPDDPLAQSSPGGGGSGGALLLQGRQVQVAGIAGRILVNGGVGGTGVGASTGGNGGVGLVRLESRVAPNAATEAPKIAPFNPDEGGGLGGADSDVFLSTGIWRFKNTGPSALSGAQSCWIQPQGNFFLVDFADDDFSAPSPADWFYGWDMNVLFNNDNPNTPNVLETLEVSWRDATDPDNQLGLAPESFLGSDFGGATPSPIVVRFQGARSIKSIADFCNVDVTDPDGAIIPESVTNWVRHPAELNDYFSFLPAEEAAALRPNMIRFQIVFDRRTAFIPALVIGVSDLVIQAQPD